MYRWLLLLIGTTAAALLVVARSEAQSGSAQWSVPPGVRQYLQYSPAARGGGVTSTPALPRPGLGYWQRQGVLDQDSADKGYYYERQSDSTGAYGWEYAESWGVSGRYLGKTRVDYYDRNARAPGYSGFSRRF